MTDPADHPTTTRTTMPKTQHAAACPAAAYIGGRCTCSVAIDGPTAEAGIHDAAVPARTWPAGTPLYGSRRPEGRLAATPTAAVRADPIEYLRLLRSETARIEGELHVATGLILDQVDFGHADCRWERHQAGGFLHVNVLSADNAVLVGFRKLPPIVRHGDWALVLKGEPDAQRPPRVLALRQALEYPSFRPVALASARKAYRSAVEALETVGVTEAGLRAMADGPPDQLAMGAPGTPWRALSEARRRFAFELLDEERGVEHGRRRADAVERAAVACCENDVTWEELSGG